MVFNFIFSHERDLNYLDWAEVKMLNFIFHCAQHIYLCFSLQIYRRKPVDRKWIKSVQAKNIRKNGKSILNNEF